MTYKILHGNNLDILPTLPDNSVDSIVTDPPYELGFMGKKWDSSGIAYSVELWQQCLRVLKPGGHLLSFGGTRTWHRVAVAIEDAGFEVRDSIAWLYGSGFPKSLDVSKAIDKNNGKITRLSDFTIWMRTTGLTVRQVTDALREANLISENGTMASHYFATSESSQPAIPTAAMWQVIRPMIAEVPNWVDEMVARIEAEREVIGQRAVPIGHAFASEKYRNSTDSKQVDETLPATPEAQQWQGWGTALKPAFEPIVVARKPLGGEIAVRTIIENELNKLGFSEVKWTKAVKPATKSNQKQTFGSTSQPKTAGTSAKTVNAKEMLDTEPTTQKSTGQLTSDLGTTTQAEQTNLLASQTSDSNNKSLKPTDLTASAVENQTEPFLPSTTSTAVEQNTGKEHQAKSGTNLDGLDSPMVIESFAGIATGLSGSLATVLINKLDDGTFEWPANLPEVEKVGTTVANNVLKWGTGGLNIDGSRIGTETISTHNAPKGSFAGGEENRGSDTSSYKTHTGRWPANVILGHTEHCSPTGKTLKNKTSAGKRTATFGTQDTQSGGDGSGGWSGYEYETEVYACVDGCPVKLLDEQSGTIKGMIGRKKEKGFRFNVAEGGQEQAFSGGISDSGGASRFFYVAKASKRDRNEGLDELEGKLPAFGNDKGDGLGRGISNTRQDVPRQNFHPTVKPTTLMEYLIKLVTPPGGTVLDPFTGSGSTGKAAILQGFDFIGIEMTEEYLPIIEGRLKHAEQLVAEAKEQDKAKENEVLF